MKRNSIRRTHLAQLDQRIKSLAGQERELLCEIIKNIQEMNLCKGYLELGYPSLFAYLHEGVGYSEGSAHRRIEAARLVAEIPEMLGDIKSGDLKLTQVVLVQQAAREKLKTSSLPVTGIEKKQILQQITQQTFKKSQQQVAAFFELPIKEQTKETIQADDSVRLEITIPRQLFEDMKHAQALMSHSVPASDWVEYLQFVTDAYLKRQSKIRNLKSKQKQAPSLEEEYSDAQNKVVAGIQSGKKPTSQTITKKSPQVLNENLTSTLETENPIPILAKPFSTRQRKILLNSTPVCQYRDPVSGRQCRSPWFLQIDHKHSRWAGGVTTLQNAQVFCGAHNRHKYAKEARLI